jgi:hypothetical protein
VGLFAVPWKDTQGWRSSQKGHFLRPGENFAKTTEDNEKEFFKIRNSRENSRL